MYTVLCLTGNIKAIKSPQYTGGDFMFLYRFVRRRRRRRRRRPQILVHAITFEQRLGFLSFLAQLLVLTCRLPDYIFVDFRRDLDLDFFKIKYGICYISAKNGPIATKRKANIAIELWGSNVTSGFDLGHDLDLEFSRSNIEFAISQPKMVRLPRNEKQTYWLNSRPQMWPMVWIYQIVTGVTSVVGVPSTHLVLYWIELGRERMTIMHKNSSVLRVVRKFQYLSGKSWQARHLHLPTYGIIYLLCENSCKSQE